MKDFIQISPNRLRRNFKTKFKNTEDTIHM